MKQLFNQGFGAPLQFARQQWRARIETSLGLRTVKVLEFARQQWRARIETRAITAVCRMADAFARQQWRARIETNLRG